MIELYLTDDERANELLATDHFALLVGMLLDQQIPMERAFRGPLELEERLRALGRTFDACSIAAMDPDDLARLVATKPALHRFPTSMAKRIHALAVSVCEHYAGDVTALWEDVRDAAELRRRVEAMPGFGNEKARIYLALLAKRFGIRPDGWERESEPFGEPGSFRSVADAVSPEAIERIRETKAAVKAARAKARQ